MIETRKKLIGNWFLKLKREEVNQEILLFSSKGNISIQAVEKLVDSIGPFVSIYIDIVSSKMGLRYREESNTDVTRNSKVLEAHRSTSSYSIYFLDRENTNIINEIKHYKNKNKNIILVMPNSYFYTDFGRPMLHLPLGAEMLDKSGFNLEQYGKNLNYFVSQNMFAPDIPYFDRYFFYIEPLAIKTIVKNRKFEVIKNFLNYYLTGTSTVPFDHSILLENTAYATSEYEFTDLLEGDLYLLENHEILTSRLAIIIYKFSFLDFKANKTKIGLFFKDHLKIKSKTISLQNLGIEYINQDLSDKHFRGYDLRSKMTQDEVTRLEIAQKLLKYKVDLKIIVKSTKLPMEQILHMHDR